MENKSNASCDLAKFWRNRDPAKREACSYETPALGTLEALMRRELSREQLSALEYGYTDDDLCACGYGVDGITLYYEEPLVDEDQFTYAEDTEMMPIGVDIAKSGVQILHPGMVIGQHLSGEEAVELLAEMADDDALLGRLPYNDGEIFDCRFRDFNLLLWLENDVLLRARLLDIGL